MSLDLNRFTQALVRVHRLLPIEKVPLLPARPGLPWPVTLAETPAEIAAQLHTPDLAYLRQDAMRYGSTGRFTRDVQGLGAWYAAESLDTCVQEVGHRFLGNLKKRLELAQHADYQVVESLVCDAMYDVTHDPLYARAITDINRYAETQVFGDQVRAGGWAGVRYPSARDPGGVCYALLRADAIRAVRPTGQVLRFEYDPAWDVPGSAPLRVRDVTSG